MTQWVCQRVCVWCVCVWVFMRANMWEEREHVRLSVSQRALFVSVYPYLNIPADSWASKAFAKNNRWLQSVFRFSTHSQFLKKQKKQKKNRLQQVLQKGPETYWFARQNYADDRQAVKIWRGLTRASTDGFCLCVKPGHCASIVCYIRRVLARKRECGFEHQGAVHACVTDGY